MLRIGDRVSMGILVLACGGTLVALTMASAAKKANLTGVPGRTQRLGKPIDESSFDERLNNLGKK
jgi:hypothetical protein